MTPAPEWWARASCQPLQEQEACWGPWHSGRRACKSLICDFTLMRSVRQAGFNLKPRKTRNLAITCGQNQHDLNFWHLSTCHFGSLDVTTARTGVLHRKTTDLNMNLFPLFTLFSWCTFYTSVRETAVSWATKQLSQVPSFWADFRMNILAQHDWKPHHQLCCQHWWWPCRSIS